MEQNTDSIAACQNHFFKLVGWNPFSQYQNFNQAARDILDIKTNTGVSFSSNNQIYDYFKSQYILSLSPQLSACVSYLSSSLPISPFQNAFKIKNLKSATLPAPLSRDLLAEDSSLKQTNPYSILKVLNYRSWDQAIVYDNFCSSETYSSIRSKANYLLSVKAYLEIKTIAGLYINQFNKDSQLKINWVSVSNKKRSLYAVAQYAINKNKWSSACTFVANSGLIGLNGIYHINGGINDLFLQPNTEKPRKSLYTVGCEIYYCLKDSGGGLSIGLKSTSTIPERFSEKTLIVNPLMGYLTLSYCQQVARNLIGATRIDYNYYNYLSEMSVGFEYWGQLKPYENNQPLTPPRDSNFIDLFYDYIVKFSFSALNPQSKQLYSSSLQFDRQFGSIIVSLGCSILFSAKHCKHQNNQEMILDSNSSITTDKDHINSIIQSNFNKSNYHETSQYNNDTFWTGILPIVDKLSLQIQFYL
ncbi:hypothetical protein BB561_006386 [Smittium simulii]|uniref:Mitochondrial distribution and morphology protein 10 n=1 Tax=Smittium simulii TaxID=133385 RepID=A0A2T9Y4Q3_9FUNG|nr:hypothetical protein BB561_006386 [Smittium simulii]